MESFVICSEFTDHLYRFYDGYENKKNTGFYVKSDSKSRHVLFDEVGKVRTFKEKNPIVQENG